MTSTPITESDVTQGAADDRLSVREKIGSAWVMRAGR